MMTAPVALITGVTGQDGAYLAEFLINKGYFFMASADVHPHSIRVGSNISIRIRTSSSYGF